MGDRYDIKLKCYKCGEWNDVWYAPSSGSTSFKCDECHLWNDVIMDFVAAKHAHDFTFSGDVCECGKEKKKSRR